MALTPGSIGVRVDQREAIALAAAHGYEAVEPYGAFLAGRSEAFLAVLNTELRAAGLVWAAAGLPVDFRGDEDRFRADLRALPAIAAGLERAGATRMGTWIRPSHATLTYRANFDRHARRLAAVADVLGDHGLRLGLEYVGTKRLWTANRHPFVHTMAETKELIAAIDRPNVGFVLDSWHWFTAGETPDDIRTLTNADVVSCDLNDAPAGVPLEEQRDGQRELPLATGVIDLEAFLGALVDIGYDGPVRPEPFNRTLNGMPDELAAAAAADALRRAFALVE